MPVTVLFTELAQQELSCCVPGCGKCVQKSASLEAVAPGKLVFRFVCENGHSNAIDVHVGAKTLEKKPELAPIKPNTPKTEHKMRAKLSGVTFDNPDGTSRQSLLRHVKQGDELCIVSGEVGGKRAYIAKHAIGTLGTVKRDVILAFSGGTPRLPIRATVVRVTGGNEEKETFGCNIELCETTQVNSNDVGTTDSKRTMADPRDNMKVFIDRDGRNIFHLDRHCSGLKATEEISLRLAVNTLKARPCKKCAASLTE